MEFETIILGKEEGVATITLNRPQSLNTLNEQLIIELLTAIRDVRDDDAARVLILTGAGSAFCAGADFRFGEVRAGGVAVEEAEEVRGKLLQDISQGQLLRSFGAEMILTLHRAEKPTIAMVNGAAVGGGFDLSLACDIRIGSENARFAIGFTRLGIIPDTGSPWFLPRIVGVGKAAELLFSGDIIDAAEAARIGLLNKIVPASELEGETTYLARRIAAGPPIAHRLSKMLLYQGLGMDLEATLAFSAAALSLTLASEDHLEGVRAFVEKRAPLYRGR